MVEHSTQYLQKVESTQLIPQLNFAVILLITPDLVLHQALVNNQETGMERPQLASKVTDLTVFTTVDRLVIALQLTLFSSISNILWHEIIVQILTSKHNTFNGITHQFHVLAKEKIKLLLLLLVAVSLMFQGFFLPCSYYYYYYVNTKILQVQGIHNTSDLYCTNLK